MFSSLTTSAHGQIDMRVISLREEEFNLQLRRPQSILKNFTVAYIIEVGWSNIVAFDP